VLDRRANRELAQAVGSEIRFRQGVIDADSAAASSKGPSPGIYGLPNYPREYAPLSA